MRVLKFGGSSIGDATSVERALRIVEGRAGEMLVTVFSAVGETTDRLCAAASDAAAGRLDQAIAELTSLRSEHLELMELFLTGDRHGFVEQECRSCFEILEKMARSLAVLRDLSPPVRARFLAFGELLSTRLLWGALRERGLPAEWIDARDLVVTNDHHDEAEPRIEGTVKKTVAGLGPLLAAGSIPVTQGFIARSENGTTTTLGRGGSDYTAALLGAALGADEIEIWTDVDGVLTADPSLVPEARNIPVMSFREAAELAFFGARVLHPMTLQPAVDRNIPVRVLNTRKPTGEGTLVLSRPGENGAPVKSIAYKEGVTVVHLVSTRMFRSHGFLERVFALFDRHRVSPNLVATSQVSVAVAFWDAEELTPLLAALRELGEVETRSHQAVVCVVGERLKETPGIVCQVFDDLADVKTSMVSVGGSEINLGFVVDESDLHLVVNRLHRRFFGGAERAARCGQGQGGVA